MGALIVSLLFLSNILDGFQALDDAGRPLPNAALTFLRSGTTIPKPVYADQELTRQLNDAQGRLVGDSLGRFPLIYLADVTEPPYRVQLHTAQGVLRWDVDPYVCDCLDPPYVFRGPKHQALDDDGEPLAGATLRFTLTETDTPVDVYADAALKVPLPNPLPSNAGGFFPPVYLQDATEYRVRATARSGAELFDIDPYVCQCGFLLLTSKMYAYQFEDAAAGLGMGVPSALYQPHFSDGALSGGIAVMSGVLSTPELPYDDWPPDAAESSGISVASATLRAPTLPYEDWPAEYADSGGISVASATMVAPIVTYVDWPEEEALSGGIAVLSGTMTT